MSVEWRKFLEAVNNGMNNTEVILREEDFVGGSVELTDDQIKQLFMILAQAAVYKKIQGTLKGYKPSFEVDKVEKLDEVRILDLLKGVRNSFVSMFGATRGEKMAKIAVNTSRDILKKWEEESVAGGISPTVENVATWVKNKGVDGELMNVAFSSLGIPNINRAFDDEEPEVPEPEADDKPETSPLERWLDDEMLQPGGFTGGLAMEFLLDQGVSEERADKMLKRIGINKGAIVAKSKYDLLNKVATRFGGADKEPVVTEPEETPGETWPASRVYDHIVKNYNVSEDKLKTAFKRLGTDSKSSEPMDVNAVNRLMSALQGKEKAPEEGNVIDKTQDILGSIGGNVGNVVSAGKKAMQSGNVGGMSELQKLGIAILAARKKI